MLGTWWSGISERVNETFISLFNEKRNPGPEQMPSKILRIWQCLVAFWNMILRKARWNMKEENKTMYIILKMYKDIIFISSSCGSTYLCDAENNRNSVGNCFNHEFEYTT